MNERRTALEILSRIERDGAFSNLALSAALDGAGLPSQARALTTALVYGVTENRYAIDYYLGRFIKTGVSKIKPRVRNILRLGAQQLLYMDRIPPSAAVNESVKLAVAVGDGYARGFVNAVLRRLASQKDTLPLPDRAADPVLYLAVRYSCPVPLVQKWLREYPDKAEGILQSLRTRLPAAAKVNTLRTTAPLLRERLVQEGVEARLSQRFDDALELPSLPDIRRLSTFCDGLFHLQGYASQTACRALGAQPGETVLDLCAAPGGKSFTIAERMNNRGRVLACELHEARVGLIAEGANRLGLTCVEPMQNDAAQPNPSLGAVDRVLCDVPCSGLGVIGRKPEIRYRSLADYDALPDLQFRILQEGASHVAPGGTLVYSTCTLSRAENDEVADRFLDEHPEFAPRALPFREAGPCRMTLFPQDGTDGFFIASFVHSGG